MRKSLSMRRFLIGLSFIFSATAANAAADVTGDWRMEDGSAIIAFARCGDQMCASIARVLINRPGIPKTDIRNPDPALRTRTIQGLRIISGLHPKGNRWEGGRVYDPKSGKSYKSYVELNPDGSLKVAGCLAFICKAQRWTRVR
jgi:uncharacterized protein (DUF2147 family)